VDGSALKGFSVFVHVMEKGVDLCYLLCSWIGIEICKIICIWMDNCN